jgi:hypothetical protein
MLSFREEAFKKFSQNSPIYFSKIENKFDPQIFVAAKF